MALPAQRNKLSRTRDQRRALLKSLAEALITHESIVTTRPKARALRPYVERLVTRAKEDNQHRRRVVLTKITTKESLDKLFTEIGPRFKDRPGGYTRIEPAGYRRGDDAEMARISFVETEAKQAPEETDKTTEEPQAEASDKKKTEASKSSPTKKAAKTADKKESA